MRDAVAPSSGKAFVSCSAPSVTQPPAISRPPSVLSTDSSGIPFRSMTAVGRIESMRAMVMISVPPP